MDRSPSQTVGPFFHEGLRWPDAHRVTFAEKGNALVLEGRLVDGAGAPVADALIETWQAAPTGGVPAPATGTSRPHGFGRTETDAGGRFQIETLMPGGAAPFLDVAIFARGLMKPLRTRIYLCSLEQARGDPALQALAASPRLGTIVAAPESPGHFRWEGRLQGEGETVFFA
jgi:protocatechuate 3,4-dioxygenase, alpha subunit